MTRDQLEHVIRAACTITDDDELVILGSQAILGQFPDAPPDLLISMEADVYPRNHPDRSLLIEGAMGELSMFHETFGYYADGVGPSTATLPAGWEDRLQIVRGPGTLRFTGLTLEVHDLLISKYVAGRPKDHVFCRTAIAHGLAGAETLRERLASTDLDESIRTRVTERIEADASGTP